MRIVKVRSVHIGVFDVYTLVCLDMYTCVCVCVWMCVYVGVLYTRFWYCYWVMVEIVFVTGHYYMHGSCRVKVRRKIRHLCGCFGGAM